MKKGRFRSSIPSASGPPGTQVEDEFRPTTYPRQARYAMRQMGSSGRWIGALLLLVAGCGSGFHYEKLSSEAYPVTQDVAWLAGEPARPYAVIARFRGAETSLCPLSQPYCSLYKEAAHHGADAIWVRRREPWTRPEQWVVIQGKMTRIPPATYEQIEGVFIRYK